MKHLIRLFIFLLCAQITVTALAPINLYSDIIAVAQDEDEEESEDSDDEDESDDDEDDEDSDDNDDDDDSEDEDDEDSENDEDNEDDSDEDSDDDHSEEDDSDDDNDEDESNDEDSDGDNNSDDEDDFEDEGEVFLTPTPSAPEGARVKIEIESNLNGELEFSVDVRGLPVGTCEIWVAGTNWGTIDIIEHGGSTRGLIEFETAPDNPSEQLLNFEVIGQLVEIYQNGIIYFAGIAPQVAQINDEGGIEIETNEIEGSTELETYLPPSGNAPVESRIKLKYEQEYDGELKLELEAKGLPVAEYEIFIGNVFRGYLSVVTYGDSTYGEISFETVPDDESEYLLDFEIAGQNIRIELDGEVYFSGVIPVPVATPSYSNSGGSEYQSVQTALLPNMGSSVLTDGRKQSVWFGVYDDSNFPIINQCVLGTVEFRFADNRNYLISPEFGVLEIVEVVASPGTYRFFSLETGRVYNLSSTDAECAVLETDSFFDESEASYSASILPEADDANGFYEIAFQATIETQEKSAQTIQFVQTGNLSEALESLKETEFFRNIAVNNANRTIQAAQIAGVDEAFWQDAAIRLIETADEALISAQGVVASAL